MRTKTAGQFREFKIYNTSDLLRRFAFKLHRIACTFYGTDPGRGGSFAHTAVWSPDFPTNPGAPWYQYSNKWFHGHREESLPKALEWAQKEYGIKEWGTCPMDTNTKIPLAVRVDALKWLKEQIKAKKATLGACP